MSDFFQTQDLICSNPLLKRLEKVFCLKIFSIQGMPQDRCVALLVRKAESKHKNENISTGESLPGVPGVSKNQKLSTEYDFNSFEVSFEVLTE